MSPRRVVTLPPSVTGPDAVTFAAKAKARRADFLEIRTDLHSELPIRTLADILPLIVSERERPLPVEWVERASKIDRDITAPITQGGDTSLPSHHALTPLTPDEALALWKSAPAISAGAWVKHIEPLGTPAQASRLWETRRLLQAHFGADRVTVLGMGPYALPFRCTLAPDNVLDYVALEPTFRAAAGQRLLDDAVREERAKPKDRRYRLGILGSHIDGSRSPRIHAQPFDRIDLPPDAPIPELLKALEPFYAGFAVTSPFKKPVAQAVQADLDAVNTLVRRRDGTGWNWANTDMEGASAILKKLGASRVVALGDGGVTSALKAAAKPLGVGLEILRRAEVSSVPLRGAFVWTWPKEVPAPEQLRFNQADVAVVAYGAAARQIAKDILARGGRPKMWGARWFIAQARRQKALWESA
jgi:hypothetical protein